MSLAENLDIVVIGAGPAGLGAAQALGGSGLKVLVVEEGRSARERDRFSPTDVPCGIGGAGLFSDGKFSFFPSATNLWSLGNVESLKRAYAAGSGFLVKHGLKVPPFPNSEISSPDIVNFWTLKQYPSSYLSFDQRLELIEDMVASTAISILDNIRVIKVTGDSSGLFIISIQDQRSSEISELTSRALIISSGRFGSLGPVSGFYPTVFRRLEVGVRIQQPAQDAFFSTLPGLDPKLRLLGASGSPEWRTFCACRDGEIVKTLSSGYWSLSGRADGPRTGKSNIGFNVRITSPAIANKALPSILHRLRQSDSLFNVPFHDFISGSLSETNRILRCFGPELSRYLQEGLSRLVRTYPQAVSDAILAGPTIEGIGYYPKLDQNLKIPDINCWVTGDATGLFRGIVAAMISGYYVGLAAASKLK